MSGGWLKRRLGPPKLITRESEIMGTTVRELETKMFRNFKKIISSEHDQLQNTTKQGKCFPEKELP
jgi:hypothetical protein